jgi:hypothetical protein
MATFMDRDEAMKETVVRFYSLGVEAVYSSVPSGIE